MPLGQICNAGPALLVAVTLLALVASPSWAQHDEHDHSAPVPEQMGEDDFSHELPPEEASEEAHDLRHPELLHADDPEMPGDHLDNSAHEDEHAEMEMEMTSMLQPSDPMTRDGSGTSWIPDQSRMYALHRTSGTWQFMFHGSAWLRFNSQDVFGSGSRGARKVDLPNWFMGMAHRRLSSSSQIGFRAMLSLDPISVGGSGYPLLFQTGETYQGEPLIDRQHPHDLFAELAVAYGHEFNEDWGVFGYFGYPGEPALGPPVYLHRPSAAHLPDAPLGHHWQDATHIIFGTATAGVRYRTLKLDGSIFTGSEPDEERFGFDRPRFNSYSGRLSLNPNERWALQISRAFLKEPEVLHPGQNQWRTSASAMYVAPTPVGSGTWATTAIWGLNELVETAGHEGHAETSPLLHSLLVETDLQIGRQAVFGRAEWVQKPATELGITDLGHNLTFDIRALSLGYARQILDLGELRLDLGGHATLYRVPSSLKSTYGSSPMSLQVYLRLSPDLMRHGRR